MLLVQFVMSDLTRCEVNELYLLIYNMDYYNVFHLLTYLSHFHFTFNLSTL